MYVIHVREDQQINFVLSGDGFALENGRLTMNYNAPNSDNYIAVINHTKKRTRYTVTAAIH